VSDVRTTEPSDEPYLGRDVAFRVENGEQGWEAAKVLRVYPDGWTCKLFVYADSSVRELCPHADVGLGGNEPELGSWLTLAEYEGWRIWANERKDLADEAEEKEAL
jgi:hypothetical protein